ncbi:MAG TPA: bifunctional [glutamate--ammonia ligase]-adenylyl-L-tyrosine phosphorylase/[glutamate--ammonia-ligase] adenylyltransferase [Steroidobacteraceae bacterium]|nr:bifunctional [glutamate--ammonia ligase]-adenylyl-L-tyrosine phosphorylase/[glutamate--ammonia-ligase] adenylyltransferase [Steroidobacteraceae bacterium]
MTEPVEPSPPLAELVESRLAQLATHAPRLAALLGKQPVLAAQARHVLLGSDFALRAMGHHDVELAALWQQGRLTEARSAADYRFLVETLLPEEADTEANAMRALRILRQCEMLRLAWRDLAGIAGLHDTLRETSWLADAMICGAARTAAALLAPRHGRPPPDAGRLMILAMGKLGGMELNFSSDVDLVFLYARGGQTDGPAPLDLEEYYTRQGRLLIRLLDQVTEDGFAFRVDMRLRPFGESGPLVASFAFLEDYLQAHGRDWERYAWIKARALTEVDRFDALREQMLRPFVYRRYLDFGVFESLREMKALIGREVRRRDRAGSIKLGPGGIREIEFIVQAFQLVRGGQDGSLREPSLLAVLPRLARSRLLPAAAVAELQCAYDFLRLLENRVQMFDDAQTHELPQEPVARARIAAALGFADAAAMEAQFHLHRARVEAHFAALFGEGGSRPGAALDLAPLWEPALGRAVLADQLAQLAQDGPALLARLESLVGGPRLRRLDEIGRRRLKQLLELLLAGHQAARDSDALRRICDILEAIGLRSAYFSLLVENQRARERLLEVARQGDFLAGQLARNPALLDELLDERWLDELPGRTALTAELAARLAEVGADDVEREVEQLARFKQAAVFRVALADLFGRLPLMQVSDRLTEIAGVILGKAMALALRQTAAQYGSPRCEEDGRPRAVAIAALGYGKFGGYELGYGSDLDLVFLHDSTGERQQTDAATPVDNQVFFLRYAQRLIHLLTVHSAAGRVYEIDVRLRPSGKGGMLVTSIAAFRSYQFGEAWTWEHQALLHARAVAGDAALMARIEAVRVEVLEHAVRRADLREQIRDMRERQRRELAKGGEGRFDLKHDRGGIADIEFLAQYWALRWAAEYPPVVHYPDTIRQLESVASAALVPQATVDVLVRAYQYYRRTAHRRALEGLDGPVEAGQYAADRAAVAAIWHATMEEPV